MSWQTDRLRGGLAAPEAQMQAAEILASQREDAAARTAGDIRGTGTLTKYRPTGGWRTPGPGYSEGGSGKESSGNLRALAEAAELGSPESYGAGRLKAGAPAPVAIMRGNQTTFQNAAAAQPGGGYVQSPGSSPREYNNSLRAGQAYNRDTGVGEYDPLEGPKLRLEADLDEKNPLQKAQADVLAGGQLSKLLEDRLLKDYGVSVKGENGQDTLTLPSEIKRLALGYRPKNAEDIESFMQKIAPEGAKIKSVTSWNDPKTGMAMRRQLLATTTDPAEQKRIKEEVVTPDNLEWFQGKRNGQPPVQQNASPDSVPQGSLLRRIGQANLQTDQAVQTGKMSPGTAFWKKNLVVPVGEAARTIAETGIEAGQAVNRGLRSVIPGSEKVISPRGNYLRFWDKDKNLRAGAPSAM